MLVLILFSYFVTSSSPRPQVEEAARVLGSLEGLLDILREGAYLLTVCAPLRTCTRQCKRMKPTRGQMQG